MRLELGEICPWGSACGVCGDLQVKEKEEAAAAEGGGRRAGGAALSTQPRSPPSTPWGRPWLNIPELQRKAQPGLALSPQGFWGGREGGQVD